MSFFKANQYQKLPKSHTLLAFGCGLALVLSNANAIKAVAADLPDKPPLMLFNDTEVSVDQVAKTFATQPVKGYIHAANRETNTFVLTYVDPHDPAKIRNVSLIAASIPIWKEISELQRFDEVEVTGEMLSRPVPQPHILVKKIEVIRHWPADGLQQATFQHDVDVNEALLENEALVGKVHAVVGGGHVLMFDYHNTVIPVVAFKTDETMGLWRGDKVSLRLEKMPSPNEPVHLMLDPYTDDAVDVITALKDLNGTTKTVKGPLVQYPSNPIYPNGGWAIEVTDADGVSWNYLLKTEYKADQAKLDAHLKQLWDIHQIDSAMGGGHKESFMVGRQKWVNPELMVEYTGVVRHINPVQPNPELLVDPDEVAKP